jgi:hypothetical protein
MSAPDGIDNQILPGLFHMLAAARGILTRFSRSRFTGDRNKRISLLRLHFLIAGTIGFESAPPAGGFFGGGSRLVLQRMQDSAPVSRRAVRGSEFVDT